MDQLFSSSQKEGALNESIPSTLINTPVTCNLLNSNNDEIEVTGLLTEFGNLINQQEKSNCRLYKKYDNLLF